MWSWEHRRQRENRRYKHFHRLEGTPHAKAFLSVGHGTESPLEKARTWRKEIFYRENRNIHVKKRWLCTIKFIHEKIKDVILVSWVHVPWVRTACPLIASPSCYYSNYNWISSFQFPTWINSFVTNTQNTISKLN